MPHLHYDNCTETCTRIGNRETCIYPHDSTSGVIHGGISLLFNTRFSSGGHDDDDDGDFDLHDFCCFRCAPRLTGSTAGNPTPIGTAPAPGPPHASAVGDPGEKTGANAELGELGAWESGLPGTARCVP